MQYVEKWAEAQKSFFENLKYGKKKFNGFKNLSKSSKLEKLKLKQLFRPFLNYSNKKLSH